MTIPQPKTRDDLIALLSITDPDELQALYDAAYAVKAAGVGRVVYYRGLVEFSNYCIKDCKYCGIRKSNDEVERFDTPREDILAMARWAWENRAAAAAHSASSSPSSAHTSVSRTGIRWCRKLLAYTASSSVTVSIDTVIARP